MSLYMYMYIYEVQLIPVHNYVLNMLTLYIMNNQSLRLGKAKQLRLKTTPLEKRKSCLRRDSNPRRSAHQADALPTEPPRQLSWAGRIFKCYAKAKFSLPS